MGSLGTLKSDYAIYAGPLITSRLRQIYIYCLDSSVKSQLHVVQIYFDTATFDEIERDVKVLFFFVIKSY